MNHTTNKHRNNLFSTKIIISLLLLILFCVPGRVLAQGTEGLVPDPISSRDLKVYARRLHLDQQQRLAMTELHQTYRDNFRKLREGDIKELIGKVTGIDNGIPDPKVVKNVIDIRRRIMSAIASLDRSFFNDLNDLLSPEQQQLLPRITRLREKQRYSIDDMMKGRVDLEQIIDDLELPPDQVKAIDDAVVEYEVSSLAATRNLHDATIEMFLNVINELEDRGLTETNVEDPMAAMGLFQALQDIMKKEGQKIISAINNKIEVDKRSAARIADLLPDSSAKRFREKVRREMYPSIYPDRNSAQPLISAALSLDNLRDDQKTVISDLEERFRQGHQRINKKMEKQQEKQFEQFLSMDPQVFMTIQEERNKLRNERRDLDKSTAEQIEKTLDPDQLARAQLAAGRIGGKDSIYYDRFINPEKKNAEQSPQPIEVDNPDERKLARAGLAPISGYDIHNMSLLLKLDRDQKEALLALHKEYLQNIKDEVRDKMSAKLKELFDAVYRQGETPDLAKHIDELDNYREKVREKVAELDSGFFDEVELLLTDDQLPVLNILRLQRAEDRYRNRNTYGMLNLKYISTEDLMLMINNLPLDDRSLDQSHKVISEYINKQLPLVEQTYKLNIQIREAWVRVQAEADQNKNHDSNDATYYMSLSARYDEKTKDIRKRQREIQQQVSDLQQTVIKKIQDVLPDKFVPDFLNDYYRKVYSDIYPDPTSADPAFNEALTLRDLTTPQYESLQKAMDEYDREHAEISGRMINVQEEISRLGNDWDDSDINRKRQQLELKLSGLRFDRDELNALTRSRIEALLTPAQAKKMRTLHQNDEQ